jgi:protein-L-isoaspartate(D-aspartate) O-methyltransferase
VIVVTAGGPRVPPALLEQLAPGGRLVMPVGDAWYGQHLVRVRRRADGTLGEERLEPVAFVPLIGAQGWPATPASEAAGHDADRGAAAPGGR